MNSTLNDQIKANRARIAEQDARRVDNGIRSCSFCHVNYTDRKAHEATELHQLKAEAVRQSFDTYQGEADKDEDDA